MVLVRSSFWFKEPGSENSKNEKRGSPLTVLRPSEALSQIREPTHNVSPCLLPCDIEISDVSEQDSKRKLQIFYEVIAKLVLHNKNKESLLNCQT